MIKRCLSVFLITGGLLLLTLFLIPSSRVFASSSQVQRPANNFVATCTGLGVSDADVLYGYCKTISGKSQTALLDLSSYIGNIDGSLEPYSAGFRDSCVDVYSVGNFYLGASCRTISGSYINSPLLNLNLYISNLNGKLVWTGH